MRAIPMNSESTVGNPPHGIPLGVSLDDDQGTESTEVATPPPTLAEDMADGDHHAQHPDIERAQEQENTNSGIPPGLFDFSMNQLFYISLTYYRIYQFRYH